MLLLGDPAVAAVPVLDCHEELVDLRRQAELMVDTRKKDPTGAWAMVRSGVASRLLTAQSTLPDAVRLLIIEGYRPPDLQRLYFDRHRTALARDLSRRDSDRLDAEAGKHVSPPAVAPHPCGAAVDLTLHRDGVELDLGTPINATPDQSAGACFTAATNTTTEARHWRDVLIAALGATGLINYPPEWWHWSYGDRYWAVTTGAGHARYDVLPPPS